MDKFIFTPNQSGYSVQDSIEVLQVELDGGAPRIRRDIVGSWPIVNVSWIFDRENFNYFREFYRLTTVSGSLPFLIDLLIDNADELTEHVAQFVPGSIALSQVSGQSYGVSANLRIKPLDVSTFPGLVAVINAFGEDWQKDLELLDSIVNTEWPGVL